MSDGTTTVDQLYNHGDNNNDIELEQFQFNVTLPHIEQFKKKNRVDIAREKLAERVKKFKRQAPRVGHLQHLVQDNQAPDFVPESKLDQDEVDHSSLTLEQQWRLKFIQYKNNCSERQTQNRFLDRVKKYHQDRYHSAILNFSSTSNSEDEQDDTMVEEEDSLSSPINLQPLTKKKQRFLKRRKRMNTTAAADHYPSSSSSNSSSTTTQSSSRRKFISSISTHSNKRRHKKRRIQLQLLVDEQQQKRQDERLRIRHRMMNFVIPADWTCIKRISPKDNTTISRDILPHPLLLNHLLENIKNQQSNINDQAEKIKINQTIIHEYKQKLLELDQNLHNLSVPTSNINNFKNDSDNDDEDSSNSSSPILKEDTKKSTNAIITNYHHYSSSHLSKSSYLLKQAYRHHKKLVKKIDKMKLSSTIRLDYLQVKVQQSLLQHHQTSSLFFIPFGLLVMTLSFFIILQVK